MECFLSAVGGSGSRKMPVNGASEAEDAFWGLFKRAFSSSSSSSSASFCVDDVHQAPCNLKRQRAAAFFMGCYLCGMEARARDGEDFENSSKERHAQRKEEDGCMQWWQERREKRRKLARSNGNLLSRAPAKFKKILRRFKAEVRKLSQFQKAASFHYDPLSYSMNFDDWCWQHCDSHAKLFSADASCNNGNLQCKKGRGPCAPVVKTGVRPCLWQRRQVRQPKTLRVTKARAFSI